MTFALLALAGCSSHISWLKARQGYHNTPVQAISNPRHAVIVVRSSWLAQTWESTETAVMDTVARRVDESFRSLWSDAPIADLGSIDTLPTETHRLDDRIFLRGFFPAQGDTLLVQGSKPATILLFHEITIGPDQDRTLLYDYAKANHFEDRPRKRPLRISCIATWTLWDNYRQRPLLDGITQSELSSEGFDKSKVNALAIDLAKQIQLQIQSGKP